eukprot:866632-Pelagomonas_calceolata.AAC.4
MNLSQCRMCISVGRGVCGGNRAANRSTPSRTVTMYNALLHDEVRWAFCGLASRFRCLAGQMDGVLSEEEQIGTLVVNVEALEGGGGRGSGRGPPQQNWHDVHWIFWYLPGWGPRFIKEADT